ncbi:hypothetical protein Q7P37_002758 [Cladosporium fusiforme]
MSDNNTKSLPTFGDRTHLLSLPYDIRHTIYKHLFPSTQIIYLKASQDGLNPMLRPGELSMSIALTCSQLYAEANDYFYNNWPINIIGYKKYCIDHYQPIHKLSERFAKNGSCLQVLDNGVISTTACVSIHPKGGRVDAMMRRRKQGNPRDLEEVTMEADCMLNVPDDDYDINFGEYRRGCDIQVMDHLGSDIERLSWLSKSWEDNDVTIPKSRPPSAAFRPQDSTDILRLWTKDDLASSDLLRRWTKEIQGIGNPSGYSVRAKFGMLELERDTEGTKTNTDAFRFFMTCSTRLRVMGAIDGNIQLESTVVVR